MRKPSHRSSVCEEIASLVDATFGLDGGGGLGASEQPTTAIHRRSGDLLDIFMLLKTERQVAQSQTKKQESQIPHEERNMMKEHGALVGRNLRYQCLVHAKVKY